MRRLARWTAGATGFLVKSVSQAEALLRIRNLLETHRVNVVLFDINARHRKKPCANARRELHEKIAELEAVNQRFQSSSTLTSA